MSTVKALLLILSTLLAALSLVFLVHEYVAFSEQLFRLILT